VALLRSLPALFIGPVVAVPPTPNWQQPANGQTSGIDDLFGFPA